MAVEERPTSNNTYEDSDDEKPLVFKRGTSSKQTEVKNFASSSHNSNGVKASPNVVRSHAETPKELSNVVYASPVKQSPVKLSASNEGSLDKPKPDLGSNNEDSDDNKPLSFRVKGAMKKDNSNVPLSLKKSPNLNHTSSAINSSSDSRGNNPLKPKVTQNGSIGNLKTGLAPSKRPIEKENIDGQISAKRPKSSSPKETAKVDVKEEADVDKDVDHIPISQRIKKSPSSNSKPSTSKKNLSKVASSSLKKRAKGKKQIGSSQYPKSTKVLPNSSDGQKKWTTLVHNGVIFPPPYNPHGIKILYKGKPVNLTPQQEEVATMFAVMKDTDYVKKPKFVENFWNDWRQILGRNHTIQKLEDCDFTPIYEWHLQEKEKKKTMTSDEKKAMKEEKMQKEEKYMWAIVDGVKEKVGNFRVEPPALFRGRGEHPKMGKLKRRISPSEITLNIGKDAPIPECPIPGERWKEVKHDNTVTWLAFWNDPINTREMKYVFLAASSSLKGQSDKEKYEKARKLKDYIHNIRAAYAKDFSSKDMMKRQIAVATYLIDKLALRAGNEKDDDEADTVGCCTLKVSNVECISPNKLKFDFLGKDSIRYENTVEVEPLVYKAIGQFRTGKKQGDDLFDLLDTLKLNATLRELMPGLSAKVFRTYNASITLDEQLHAETGDGDVNEKMLVYNQANKQVAIICNHQRTISKNHGEQMSKLTEKIGELKEVLKELKTDLERAKKKKPPLKDANGKPKKNLSPEVLEKKIATTNQKIEKMEFSMHTKEDLKAIALGTSKVNYLDPRITVAWCKRHEVPMEKIFNKSLIAKFAWSMDVDPDFRF